WFSCPLVLLMPDEGTTFGEPPDGRTAEPGSGQAAGGGAAGLFTRTAPVISHRELRARRVRVASRASIQTEKASQSAIRPPWPATTAAAATAKMARFTRPVTAR